MPTTNAAGVPRPTAEVLGELQARLNATAKATKTPLTLEVIKLLAEARNGLWRYKLVGRAYVVMQSCLAVKMDQLVFPQKKPGFVVECVATFMAESGGQHLIKSPVNKDGSYDLGDKQLNSNGLNYTDAIASDFWASAEFARRLMEDRIRRKQHPLQPWYAWVNKRHEPWMEVASEAAMWLEAPDRTRVWL
jgi:hypothetical protein